MYSYSLIVSGERFGLWLEVAQLIRGEKGHSRGVLLFCSQFNFERQEDAWQNWVRYWRASGCQM